ncbi:MAG: CoA pyrophosphatase [Syntrophales bacterium]|nr:CoA pyrophosphatase [Syntrophales bacterium]
MNKDTIIRHIVERLGTTEINYREDPGRDAAVFEAGVLIPLFFTAGQSRNDGELSFLLSKRSAAVSQSGDLSGPGGKLEPFWDHLLRFFIIRGFPSLMRGDARMYAGKRGKTAFDTITLFLANAVRESWEEIRLSPFNLRFLGPLPPRNLLMFTKTIFPVVGLIEKRWGFRPNREVDKLIEIPLDAFYHEENYGLLSIRSQEDAAGSSGNDRCFPCLIHTDSDGEEEILWGATFSIITSFMGIVFDFELPQIQPERTITRPLQPDYLGGSRTRSSKLLDKILPGR